MSSKSDNTNTIIGGIVLCIFVGFLVVVLPALFKLAIIGALAVGAVVVIAKFLGIKAK